MQAQERLSKLLRCGPGESNPVVEPGMILFSKETAMGIIKVVLASSFPDQVQEQTQVRKTYQVSLLTWESKR